jgi:hypothetical protein
MTIECVKKNPDPKNDKFSGLCNNCRSEFMALRKDLKIQFCADRITASHFAKTECCECRNGIITFYKK